MLIAIDYDDTYTADPGLWSEFIHHAQERGHRVIGVTCRRGTAENRDDVKMPLPWNDIYFTGLSAKKWFLEQRGIHVDVWVEDDPACILSGK